MRNAEVLPLGMKTKELEGRESPMFLSVPVWSGVSVSPSWELEGGKRRGSGS